MYAVIKTGGKQYRVQEGETIDLELLPIAVGDTINFTEVLMLVDGENVSCGSSLVNATVAAEVIKHARHPKIRIIKFRRRKHYMRRMGHRQHYTQVKITQISTLNQEAQNGA